MIAPTAVQWRACWRILRLVGKQRGKDGKGHSWVEGIVIDEKRAGRNILSRKCVEGCGLVNSQGQDGVR